MKKHRLLFVLGTRPEAIKCAPVILPCRRDPQFETLLLTTSQHRRLQDEVLRFFAIDVDHDLNLMQEQPDLTRLIGEAWRGISDYIKQVKPDLLLVQGDTSTAFIAALAGFYEKVPVAHIEAGLRTYDKEMPFPEEGNRCMISQIARLHFAPTRLARENLLKEQVAEPGIFVVGNPGIDALLLARRIADPAEIRAELPQLDPDRKLVLVTCHRRENWGENLRRLCSALRQLAQHRPDVQFLFLTHPNPEVKRVVEEELKSTAGILAGSSVTYGVMASLLDACFMLLTDSGGLQEEAPVLGKPILVLRDKTERPEGVQQGAAVLVGTDPERIVAETRQCLENPAYYRRFNRSISPYGDGKAAGRIHQGLRSFFRIGERPPEFEG